MLRGGAPAAQTGSCQGRRCRHSLDQPGAPGNGAQLVLRRVALPAKANGLRRWKCGSTGQVGHRDVQSWQAS